MLELAGLVRRRKGAFQATRKARELLEPGRAGELFTLLFRTHFRTFNLAYVDRAPEAPEFQRTIAFSLYRFARVGGDYMSKRYFTYLNDQSVGARLLVDASIGYRLTGMGGVLDGLAIEGSVNNLTNRRYISTIGTNGYTARGDNQTLLAGAPRQWFVTLRRGF